MATIPTTKTYDPEDYKLSFASLPIGGYADGDAIKITRANPAGTTTNGSRGDAVVTISRKTNGQVEVTLLASSDSNDDLNAAAEAFERQVIRGDGFGEFFMKDSNGDTFAHCERAYVQKKADTTGGATNGNRVWIIDCPILEYGVGGSVV